MPKYVKKPIPVTAIQWTGENHIELAEFTNGKCLFPVGESTIVIPTLEGDMKPMPEITSSEVSMASFTLAVKTFS